MTKSAAALACAWVSVAVCAAGSAPIEPCDELLQAYLKHRISAGQLQREWVHALEVKDIRLVTSKKPEHGQSLPARLAARWGTRLEQLKHWIRDNDSLVQRIVNLEPPHGPLPIPPVRSFLEVRMWHLPQARDIGRMLMANAVLAERDGERRLYWKACDHVISLLASGHSHVELAVAVGLESAKWDLFLSGLEQQPEIYKPLIAEAQSHVTRRELGSVIREYSRCFVLCEMQDPESVWSIVYGPFSAEQFKLLDQAYSELASTVETLSSADELRAFQERIPDESLAKTVSEEIEMFLERLLDFVLYLEDLRSITKTIAAEGPDALQRLKTRSLTLLPEKETWIATRGSRRVQIWPPDDFVNQGGFSRLHPRPGSESAPDKQAPDEDRSQATERSD